MDTPTVSPERAQYQAALERHTTIAHRAAVAFAAIHYLTDKRDALQLTIDEHVNRIKDIHNTGATRSSGMARQGALQQIEEIEREIASLRSVLALGESMKAGYIEQANTFAPQRDETAKLVKRMKDELILLERAGYHYEVRNDQEAHSRVKGSR